MTNNPKKSLSQVTTAVLALALIAPGAARAGGFVSSFFGSLLGTACGIALADTPRPVYYCPAEVEYREEYCDCGCGRIIERRVTRRKKMHRRAAHCHFWL